MNPVEAPQSSPGVIQLITGPMWSGKTTEMIRMCNRYKIANQRVTVVKSNKIPFESKFYVVSHDKFIFSLFVTTTK